MKDIKLKVSKKGNWFNFASKVSIHPEALAGFKANDLSKITVSEFEGWKYYSPCETVSQDLLDKVVPFD